DYIPHNHIPAFTRFNVFLRDDFTCQYCCKKFSTKELTFDHLIPRSKGGLTNWENVVTSCSHCNWTKGSRSLSQVGFKLIRKPKEPSQYSLRLKSKNFPSDYLHSSWRDYLYWDSILERD
ncbi:HNH endonuclease, partial [Alphaproteobacteria bacterium]|nr:HNH endonuclease [Alphaproteobacteria bacterium]